MPGINGELEEQPARSNADVDISGGQSQRKDCYLQRRMIEMATKSMRR
jgi:hypothetical protein